MAGRRPAQLSETVRSLVAVSAVAFALPGRPGLSKAQAEDLARLLVIGRNLAASELAGRIRAEAGLDPAHPPVSRDIQLSPLDLEQIAAVFTDGPDLLEEPAFERLNWAVIAALSHE
jgi:hypothetical protein